LSRATITVTLSLAEKTYQHRLPEGASVESLMDAAQGAGEISYAAKRYSGLGMLVTSIDGKENDADGSDMYWILSVNGKKTTTGASTYLFRDGDVVTWTYEKNEYN
jgi:imidazole glycerol phosphate synthase subunit HisF